MKKGYPYVDRMRIIAAICVVAIHIYPFSQINPILDFIVTRVIGRLAVPFFFITTAFFLFQDGYPSSSRIKRTLSELVKWYFISIVIYVPLLIYNHYFSQDQIVFELIKDILIDGVFYHLWYFPAMIFGLIIVLFLEKYLSSCALIITIVLYMIGLCGDSYYGIVTQNAFIQNIFTVFFQYMDYTRNGLFFAPLFIMIGIFLTQQKKHLKHGLNLFFFLVTLALMMGEAQVLHAIQSVKHDAMYVMLPFVSYFLMSLLLNQKGKRSLYCKNISLWIYIIHPLMIVAVRTIGKSIGCLPLVENNFIQFLCVLLYSFLFANIMHYLMIRRTL